ncbi:spore coat protein [Alicyclobacillus macrosporangiidus]|jgi:spore coat protein CotF|uniref:Spore coat protein CotF n=1 Tax=Alicyclobacillus macrosporangiidus TaxID=392015 RepID=A0A1I7JPQ0_9BACL|nr:spore coat protein [Alicyclobacillus macrosporangiidus]SFU87125.1 Spore coat protein CotF [Alicyclobacillus macrosporangiidus]
MPLMTHEACELNELLMSCVNSINCMGLFLSQVKCQELKGILQKHIAAHIQDYNMKVEWATKQSSQQKLGVPPMPPATAGGTHTMAQPVTPNPQMTALDDRSIATSYLLTLKRAGRDYAWAAMECTDPQLRTFLEDAFMMCCRHAFEVSQYMIKKGYYLTEPAPATYMQRLGQAYAPVRELAGVH